VDGIEKSAKSHVTSVTIVAHLTATFPLIGARAVEGRLVWDLHFVLQGFCIGRLLMHDSIWGADRVAKERSMEVIAKSILTKYSVACFASGNQSSLATVMFITGLCLAMDSSAMDSPLSVLPRTN
jgi:hypothetical protein